MIEKHPLKPFLPENAKILMLGSFPPPMIRWSMNFFYPNWINDMWRIMGIVFYNDKHYFEVKGEKSFNKILIEQFCSEQGIALFDTACEVRRLNNNASDKFLEIITNTDINSLLDRLPRCNSIVTTGEKASVIIANNFCCEIPKIGEYREVMFNNRNLKFWRMLSSSRAYPLKLEKKADLYRVIFDK